MSRKFDYLGDVEVFIAVVEHGSFTAAALLTLMAILTLFLKSVVQWRLENQEKRQHQEGNHEH